MNKNTLFVISLVLFSVSALFLLRSSTEGAPPDKIQEEKPTPVQSQNCFVVPPAPFDFAGETVPMEEREVYERLDREIHVNTYFHSSTIQIIKLSNRWFPTIERILEENDVPSDFKYLAAAESGLRNVVSPAGARGVWQIMTSTGREYDLTIDKYVDERYNVEKATEAACKYLKKAYGKFGSWTLAAAAFNRGMDGIENELKDQQVDNYYDLLLNSETSRYVFRVLALKAIISSPSDYGFCFEQSDLYPIEEYTTVSIDTSIPDLVNFAKAHNTTYKMIKHLNPWLRDGSLMLRNGNSYEIKLPTS